MDGTAPLSSTCESCSPVGVLEQRRITWLALIAALAVALGLLWRPLSQMGVGLWGPADPWTNGDFLGAYWLFWSAAQPENWVSRLNWPWGEGPILTSFPNPFDAWLIGPIVAQLTFPAWWNGMTLTHHLGNVAGTVALARAAGARGLPAAAAGALVAASPVMLLEQTLGHTLTAAIWPGLFGLAALLTGRGVLAGLLIGVQGLAYLYTGLAVGLAALLLRPTRGLLVALIVMGPYLAWLFPMLPDATATGPPDGYTNFPLDGLVWMAQQPQYRIHPVLLLGLIAPLWARDRTQARRLVAIALVVLVVALGPTIVVSRGAEALVSSPTAWLLAGVPGMGRMHHPVRLMLLAVPILAVLIATGIHRLPDIVALGLLALALPTWSTIDNTVAWPGDPNPPGAEAAAWVAERGEAVVDLGSHGSEALGLQPIHRLPVLAGYHPRKFPRPGLDPAVFEAVSAWATGAPQPSLPATLRSLGYTHVLAIDRPHRTPVDVTAVEQALGPAVFPGVYALE